MKILLRNNVQGNQASLYLFVFIAVAMILSACGVTFVRNVEARDDQQEYKNAETAQGEITNSIKSAMETEPVTGVLVDDDAADDPAIWYNEAAPEKSVIFGSNKKHGIHAYNLQGKQLQDIACGRINNIDVRKGVLLGGKEVDVLAGSSKDYSIVLFIIDENGTINNTPDYKVGLGDFKPYGFCLYKAEDKSLHAYVNRKLGDVFQIKVGLDDEGAIRSEVLRKLKLDTQVEGMVVDDNTHKLYVGEEQTGIHVFSARSDGSVNSKLLKRSTSTNKALRFDIEGLALLPPHYLIASSQGNFTYAIFDLKNNDYVTSFRIIDGKVDGVQETDGLEVLSANMGSDFPMGMLVVQDGFNFDGKTKKAQNFKIIKLEDVITLLEK